jgi:hypothetical protein
MYEKAAFVFWTTLGLYLVTLFTVTYVGVYLTYIAIPFIALSGLVMLIAKPADKTQKYIEESKHIANETMNTISSGLDNFGEWADQQSLIAQERASEVKKNHKNKMRLIVIDEIEGKRKEINDSEIKAKNNILPYDDYIKVKESLDKEISLLLELLEKDAVDIAKYFDSQAKREIV